MNVEDFYVALVMAGTGWVPVAEHGKQAGVVADYDRDVCGIVLANGARVRLMSGSRGMPVWAYESGSTDPEPYVSDKPSGDALPGDHPVDAV